MPAVSEHITTTEIQEFVNRNPDLYHCIGMIVPPRPGVWICIVRMEHENYPPSTPLNDKFHLFLIQWQEILWTMISFPKGDLDKLTTIASECGLRVAHSIPATITAEGVQSFPIRSDNLFHLENTRGHLVYNNDPQTTGDLLDGENIAIEEAFQKIKLKH